MLTTEVVNVLVLTSLLVRHMESGIANIQIERKEEACWPVDPFLSGVPGQICCYLLDGVPVQRVYLERRNS